jgi:predicted nucleotidyltransferase
MEKSFGVGDTVEVILLEKKASLHHSKSLDKLSDFKSKLIKDIFSELNKFKKIKQAFIVGSFLTQKSEYNDIDILVITEKERLDKEIYDSLTEKFELKFHVIAIKEKSLEYLQKSCPLTRSMLYFFVSEKPYSLPKETDLDKDHIRFLLMMPQDLLKLKLSPRIFYDSIRRIITIEKFLEGKEINPIRIEEEIIALIGKPIVQNIRSNEEVPERIIKRLKKIIKTKLDKIGQRLK